MTFEVRLSPAARRDVERLVLHLDDDSPAAAARLRSSLETALASLAELPHRGRAGPREHYRELVVPFGRSAYLIWYRVAQSTVDIARIKHHRERR